MFLNSKCAASFVEIVRIYAFVMYVHVCARVFDLVYSLNFLKCGVGVI